MDKIGTATSPNVAPTGYALAHNEVWVNGIRHEVSRDEAELDLRILAAGTAGTYALVETVELDKQQVKIEAA